MSCESAWNQKQTPLPSPCNPSPAAFNWKDGSVSLMPFPPTRNEFNRIRDVYSQNNQMIEYECSTIQNSLSVIRQLPGRGSRMIQGTYPLVNQPLVNGPNSTQDSNLLQHQLSSNKTSIFFHPPTDMMLLNKLNGTTNLQYHQQSTERAQLATDRMIVNKSNETIYLQHHQLPSDGVYPSTDQMLVNNSNRIPYLQHNELSSDGANRIRDFHPVTSQQSCSLSYQLPSNGMNMNQNSNMLNQQLLINASQSKNLPNHVLFQNEFRGNQVKYSPDDQQSARESIMSPVSHFIFSPYSKDGLNLIQNQNIPSQQIVGNQGSNALSNFPEMGSNENHELQVFDRSLYRNLFPQYSEKVYICVVGHANCGKVDLIRTFAKDNEFRISTNRPLIRVMEQVMVAFETTLKIEIWQGEDSTSSVDDIRSFCQSSKSVIVLVYSVAQKSSLSNVLEWIKFLESDKDFDVPIILVGNTTDAHCSSTSREFGGIKSDLVQFRSGIKAEEEYDFAGFYECSTKCVNDVDKIILSSALKAFNRKIQK